MKKHSLTLFVLVAFVCGFAAGPAWASKPPKGTSRSALRPKPVPAVEGYDPVAKLKQAAARPAPRPVGLGMGRAAATVEEEPAEELREETEEPAEPEAAEEPEAPEELEEPETPEESENAAELREMVENIASEHGLELNS